MDAANEIDTCHVIMTDTKVIPGKTRREGRKNRAAGFPRSRSPIAHITGSPLMGQGAHGERGMRCMQVTLVKG